MSEVQWQRQSHLMEPCLRLVPAQTPLLLDAIEQQQQQYQEEAAEVAQAVRVSGKHTWRGCQRRRRVGSLGTGLLQPPHGLLIAVAHNEAVPCRCEGCEATISKFGGEEKAAKYTLPLLASD